MSNAELVRTAMTELFVKRDVSAVDRYWDASYIQHNPKMPNGIDFLKKLVPSLPATFQYESGLVVAEGEFVMAHGRYVGWAPKPMVAVDIFRVKGDKLVEHWDVIQEEVPASQALSGNPMFPIR